MSGKQSAGLAIISGGPSTEHDASIASVANVLEQLDRERFRNVRVAYLPRSTSNVFIEVPSSEFSGPEARFLAMPAQPMTKFADWVGNDFVFNLAHGHGGEDGVLAGFLKVVGVRSSTSQVLQPAMTMAKWVTGPTVAALMADTELRTPATLVLRAGYDELPALCPFPEDQVVVKPGELGASILTELMPWDPTKITELARKIQEFCPTTLVQHRIIGREFSVGLVEIDGQLTALPVMEIGTPAGFFDHNLKHGVGAVEVIVDEPITRRLQQLTTQLGRRFGISGWARVDWIVDGAGVPYFLEVNYLPGLMRNSLYPAMLAGAGLSITDLVASLAAAAAWSPHFNPVFRYEVA